MWYVILASSKCSDLTSVLQVAAAKGLVAGSFSIKRKDESTVDYSAEPEVSNIFFSSYFVG